MHDYITFSFEAKVAPARFDGLAIQRAKTGFGVACKRFVETLRHLVTMLRHHSPIRQRFGSAQLAFPVEGLSDAGRKYLFGYPTRQTADSWQDLQQVILVGDFNQANSRLVGGQKSVPSLVTT